VGLCQGTLPRDAFQHYVGQDFFYLGAYLESYATALERVDAEADPETHAVISRLHRACQDETGLHSAYCAKWGVDPTVAEPSEPCLAYVNFLLGVVRSGAPVHEILVAMLPCTRLYAWLGRLMLLADGQRNQYGAWVMNYGTEDFQALAATKEAMIDRICPQDSATYQKLLGYYREAMRQEVNFWGAHPGLHLQRMNLGAVEVDPSYGLSAEQLQQVANAAAACKGNATDGKAPMSIRLSPGWRLTISGPTAAVPSSTARPLFHVPRDGATGRLLDDAPGEYTATGWHETLAFLTS